MRFLLAGVVLGVAFWDTRAQPLAWVGIVLLTLALHRARTRREALVGGFVILLVKQVVALYWMLPTLLHHFNLKLSVALGLCTLMFVLLAAILLAPVAAGLLLPGSFPIRWWLPGAWAGGEVLVEQLSGASMSHFLHSQWTVQPVLRCLAYVGWFPTLLLILYICSCIGDAIALRSPRVLLAPLVAGVFLLFLPPIPASNNPLRGIAAMHLTSAAEMPKAIPAGMDLVVWPEASIRGRHPISEGLQHSTVRLPTFTPLSGAHSIVGLTLKTPRGNLNAAAALDPVGTVLATRGKSVLVPVGERTFWGVSALKGEGFRPGREQPLLFIASKKVVPVICYEIFSRTVVARGMQAGGELLAILASDRPLAGSRMAMEQALGVAVLRAVEFHVPAVRASVGGVSALVSADGQILARSSWEKSEVLVFSATVHQDSPPHSMDGGSHVLGGALASEADAASR